MLKTYQGKQIMISISLPDGNLKAFENPTTGLELAESISENFARSCVAMELDKQLVDLKTPITADAEVRLITQKDPEALDILRHSAAHVMAQAILRLYKDAKLTIGPAVDDGFYYDIDLDRFPKMIFPKLRRKSKKLLKPNCPSTAGKFLKPKHWSFTKMSHINWK